VKKLLIIFIAGNIPVSSIVSELVNVSSYIVTLHSSSSTYLKLLVEN
jgi:hypothetical protein